jgi:pyruvate kinase
MMNPELLSIQKQLVDLETEMQAMEDRFSELLSHVHPSNLESAKNLLHYLVLRKTPIQELQTLLHGHGFSSLASCESHTRHQVQVVLERLGKRILQPSSVSIDYGVQKTQHSSQVLFGKPKKEWPSSVMVTFDRSFLEQKNLVRSLLKNGMGVARINCGHDDEAVWLEMVKEVREESKNTGIPCKIHVDLAGPKIRTALLNKGKKKGRVKLKKGAEIWLSESAGNFSDNEVVVSPNEKGAIQSLKVGDRVYFDEGLIFTRVAKITKKGALLIVERNSAKKKRESTFRIPN